MASGGGYTVLTQSSFDFGRRPGVCSVCHLAPRVLTTPTLGYTTVSVVRASQESRLWESSREKLHIRSDRVLPPNNLLVTSVTLSTHGGVAGAQRLA